MEYLNIPGSNIRLSDGSIVVLDRFPGVKWVVHNGWYRYNGKQYQGWYFSSIPAQTIVPVSDSDLRLLTVLSNGECDMSSGYPNNPTYPMDPGCPSPPDGSWWPGPPNPIYPPVPPIDPGHLPVPFTHRLRDQLLSAFISVETLDKRDRLIPEEIPNGKIVRVNNVEGEPKYYIWDRYNRKWDDFDVVFSDDLESILSGYYTKGEVDIAVADLVSAIEEIEQKIGSYIETISTDRGSAILVDDSDPQHVKLSLNIAEGEHAGNVVISECSDGLRASVEIPEDDVQSLSPDEKMLYLTGTSLNSQLSIHHVIEDIGTGEKPWLVLRGHNGAEINRLDISVLQRKLIAGSNINITMGGGPHGEDVISAIIDDIHIDKELILESLGYEEVELSFISNGQEVTMKVLAAKEESEIPDTGSESGTGGVENG